ncbi:unannotated protein [freshwater metagenome]|uniref:Unannotated protein n=1 Tax=freshwater metagenome TaxID=449393 RepID=A0A6J7DN32_9ZZZZ|nr:TetR family transcriptional regulator [Actinomycetota bacterium]
MKAAEMRRDLLSAASDVFARSGYRASSLEEIAQAAGVSKAVVYEHFDSKRELHAELLEARVSELVRRLQASADLGETGEERLRGGIRTFFGFVAEHRAEWDGLLRDPGDAEIAATLTAIHQEVVGVVAGLLAAEPDILGDQDEDPDGRALMLEAHAQQLVGATRALAAWWQEHEAIPLEMVLDRAMEFCWIGMARISAGTRLDGGPSVG